MPMMRVMYGSSSSSPSYVTLAHLAFGFRTTRIDKMRGVMYLVGTDTVHIRRRDLRNHRSRLTTVLLPEDVVTSVRPLDLPRVYSRPSARMVLLTGTSNACTS